LRSLLPEKIVHSSISSSEVSAVVSSEPSAPPTLELSAPFTRVPHLDWRRITAWTLAVAVAALAMAEVVLRRAGFEPTIQDSPTLWAQQRARLEAPEVASDAAVFIGRSRIMQAMDREALTERFPSRTFIQLAVAGLDRHPLAVLRDIAETTTFSGLLVTSVTEDSFERQNWGGQEDLVDYYHNKFRLNESINERISVLTQSGVALIRPEVSLRELATTVLRRGFAPTPGVEMDRYRFRNTEFQETEFAEQRLRIGRERLRSQISEVISGRVDKPDAEAWFRDVLEVERWVEQIQSRGGRVVYLRMPTAGEMWELGDLLYPRERFWNVLTASTAAATIHFADHPSLSNFELPDLSHVRGDERGRFTNALIDVLSHKGLM
jgi:hypothetical protein